MKPVYLVIGIILTFILLYLLLININNVSEVDLVSGSTIQLKSWMVVLSCGILGSGIAASICAYLFQFEKAKSNKQFRVAEKASIKAEESQDKVKALEAKIQTLEQALKKALKESN